MKKRSIIFYGVGWYLMIPPMLDPSKFIPNIHAPLNKWSQIDSYSRVEQCKFDKKLKSLLADKNALKRSCGNGHKKQDPIQTRTISLEL